MTADELYPNLRAENAEVVILPADRKYGVLMVGAQGTGKTSALISLYLNDCRDPDAAPLVLDFKSELARLALAETPPDCGKQVWFLDLGRPAFGMNPLIRPGERPLPVEAAAIAENVVAALLDINVNQLFQSSRRYLYHAVIGALALAERQARRPRFEDLYSLLLPARQDFRDAVAQACADQPDLDQTAEFFRSELPDELRIAGSATAQRLDAPRNKLAGLTGVPPLRRFFNHPTDVSLRSIIEARDILIVDANMGAIGEDNSKACMHFLLRMLHTQMQRQVHQPESERPRVPLIMDDAHYIVGGENVVDQFATHRRAGLEPALGIQYFAQLGSGSEHEQKIRKGVLNLLQSRFLFRMGDSEDAEQATRIAMAVFTSLIRDDPDSRARLRVTPEQALNFPNHYCLASWIANGSRAPCFTGQTYPLPDYDPVWAEHHLALQAKRVAPYPDDLDSTLNTNTPILDAPAKNDDAAGNGRVQEEDRDSETATGHRQPTKGRPRVQRVDGPPVAAAPASRPVKREVRVDYEAPPAPPRLDTSPVRRIVGRRVGDDPPRRDPAAEAPESLRELAFLDRINDVGPADELPGAAALPRLYDEDYAILALVDRAGLVPTSLIGRAVLPGRAVRTINDRLVKLHRHGLLARHHTGLREHTRADGKPPVLYSLTRRGLQIAQTRQPAPAISPKREWRAIEQGRALRLRHDLHALGWGIELHRLVGPVATDHWRTDRYATGRYPVPQTGSGRDRHLVTLNELPLPDGQAIIDLQQRAFTEVKPDLSLELHIPSMRLTFDLLVEFDLTARASHNRDKFLAYDAFLCGWALAHRRYQTQGTRPVVVFVCPDPRGALTLARAADEAMSGRLGVMGTTPEHWYYPGRDHVFFATEADLHHHDLTALALPNRPAGLREQLSGARELRLERVQLLPETLIAANRKRA
jgi:Replication-relaxation/Type IV secretion-system coupling protein DNA-binding domain